MTPTRLRDRGTQQDKEEHGVHHVCECLGPRGVRMGAARFRKRRGIVLVKLRVLGFYECLIPLYTTVGGLLRFTVKYTCEHNKQTTKGVIEKQSVLLAHTRESHRKTQTEVQAK